jgi:hypothetical protein
MHKMFVTFIVCRPDCRMLPIRQLQDNPGRTSGV